MQDRIGLAAIAFGVLCLVGYLLGGPAAALGLAVAGVAGLAWYVAVRSGVRISGCRRPPRKSPRNGR